MNMTGLKHAFYLKNSLSISLWTTIYLIPGGRKIKLFSPTLNKLAKQICSVFGNFPNLSTKGADFIDFHKLEKHITLNTLNLIFALLTYLYEI